VFTQYEAHETPAATTSDGIPIAGFRLPSSQSFTQAINMEQKAMQILTQSVPAPAPFVDESIFSDSEDENHENDCQQQQKLAVQMTIEKEVALNPLEMIETVGEQVLTEEQLEDLDVQECSLDDDERLEETEIAVKIDTDAAANNPKFESAESWLLYLEEHNSRTRYEAVAKLFTDFIENYRKNNPNKKISNIQIAVPWMADLQKQTVEVVDRKAETIEKLKAEAEAKLIGNAEVEVDNNIDKQNSVECHRNKRQKKNHHKKEEVRKEEKKQKKKLLKKKYAPTTLASWYSIIWQFCRHSGWGDIKKECPIIGDMIKKWMKVYNYYYYYYYYYYYHLESYNKEICDFNRGRIATVS